MTTQLTSTTYNALRGEIVQILEAGKERARQAVEQEKVRSYWEVGRVLRHHLLRHKDRADYGRQTVARLAGDVGIGGRRLYEMMQLYEYFPNLRPAANLTWSHYQVVLRAPSQPERDFYLCEAARQNWSKRALQAHIREDAFQQAQAQPPDEAAHKPEAEPALPARRGRLYTYRTAKSPEGEGKGAWLDLGFEVYRPAVRVERLGQGVRRATVRSTRQSAAPEGYRFQSVQVGADALYTYRATVQRVIDGDTLWVFIDCGFGIWTRQKLRLKGIDTPELPTPSAQKARDFVRRALAQVSFVIVATSESDKYDRYLADIFYLPGEPDAEAVLRRGIHLNQQLLDEGLAVRFGA